jgi:hypothetical protein
LTAAAATHLDHDHLALTHKPLCFAPPLRSLLGSQRWLQSLRGCRQRGGLSCEAAIAALLCRVLRCICCRCCRALSVLLPLLLLLSWFGHQPVWLARCSPQSQAGAAAAGVGGVATSAPRKGHWPRRGISTCIMASWGCDCAPGGTHANCSCCQPAGTAGERSGAAGSMRETLSSPNDATKLQQLS